VKSVGADGEDEGEEEFRAAAAAAAAAARRIDNQLHSSPLCTRTECKPTVHDTVSRRLSHACIPGAAK